VDARVHVDAEGFIRVDEVGRVAHVSDVYAIGDGASHMFKQGGLATQQGEVAARVILGETLDGTEPVLRALVITGRDPIYLRRRLDHDADAEVSRSPLWWPPSKIAGKRLSTFLESLDDRPGLERRIAESVSPGVRRVGVIAP
jgi:sulfide:quinone oxidoreductase